MTITGDQINRKRKELGLTQKQLAEKIGVSYQTIQNWESGKNIPKSKYQILEKELLNIRHSVIDHQKSNIETEQTEQYITNSNGNKYKELSDGTYLIEVKVVPFEAFARYASEFSPNEAELFGEWENVTFIVDRIGLGNYLGFRVKGDSMDGGLLNDTPDKAIVLARELGRQHWNDGFSPTKYGWIIVTKDNILFKDIIGFDKVNGTIKCHSRNQSPEYSDFDYPLNDVRQIFKVIKRTM